MRPAEHGPAPEDVRILWLKLDPDGNLVRTQVLLKEALVEWLGRRVLDDVRLRRRHVFLEEHRNLWKLLDLWVPGGAQLVSVVPDERYLLRELPLWDLIAIEHDF